MGGVIFGAILALNTPSSFCIYNIQTLLTYTYILTVYTNYFTTIIIPTEKQLKVVDL